MLAFAAPDLDCPDCSPRGEEAPAGAGVLPEHPDTAREANTVKPMAIVRMRM